MLLGTFLSPFPWLMYLQYNSDHSVVASTYWVAYTVGAADRSSVRNCWMDTGHLHTLRPIFHLQESSSEHRGWHCSFTLEFLFSNNLLCNSLLLNLLVFVERENRCNCPQLLMEELPEPASTTIDSPSELTCIGDGNAHITQRTVCVTQNNGGRLT